MGINAMVNFTVTDEDIEGMVRRDLWEVTKRDGLRPAGAFAAGALLVWLYPLVGAVAFGMGLAWLYSLVQALRGVRPYYKSKHGSEAGPVTVELRDDGIHTEM